MKKMILKYLGLILVLLISPLYAFAQKELAREILEDERLETVKEMGYEILKTGFNAGDGYQQVWARDLNTFVRHSLEVMPREKVREALIGFLKFQGFDGNMPGGYEEVPPEHSADNYHTHSRYDMPGYVFHKNTVETDQETSVIQSFYKYIQKTGDYGILEEEVNGKTVYERLAFSLDYLMKWKFNEEYGLLWGATTTDWGDVQPMHDPSVNGTKYDEYSAPAIDIYDNAMFLIALDNFIELSSDEAVREHWQSVYDHVKTAVRKHLWDEERQKFKPHIYITFDPFAEYSFDEAEIFYHGGTAVAAQAGLLTKEELLTSLEKMVNNQQLSGAQSIGLTLYPPYPEESFVNEGFAPYQYQNGGDWTWFGGRMIIALAQSGCYKEAWTHLQPFLDRVIKHEGFYEWYSMSGTPHGSGTFRGSAGVLMEAVELLQDWAFGQNTGIGD